MLYTIGPAVKPSAFTCVYKVEEELCREIVRTVKRRWGRGITLRVDGKKTDLVFIVALPVTTIVNQNFLLL
jgi:hypothetical protein